MAMDATFVERNGWFLEFYDESRSWAAADFRDWREHEDRAARLYVWQPGIIDGLLQTKDYARALIAAVPRVPAETASTRLEARTDMDNWRKSSYSDGNGGACVETASASGGVLVRDTANGSGAVLTITASAWRTFINGVRPS